MRKLLLLIALLLQPAPTFAAWSLVASTCQYTDTSGNDYTTSGITTTGADLLVALVTHWSGSTSVVFSDSNSNSWTALTEVTAEPSGRLYYAFNTVGKVGSGHTFTVANGNNMYNQMVCVLAFSGSLTSSNPHDTDATGQALSQTVQPSAITTGFNNTLVVSGASAGEMDSITSVDSGFSTPVQIDVTGTGLVAGIAYKTEANVGTNEQPTWTFNTTPTTYNNVAYIVSFQIAPSGVLVRHKPVLIQ